MSKTTNPTNTNDIDDEEYDEFEESFPNIVDDDGDINRNNNDTLSYQNQLQTSAFSEKINRLQEQIRTAQHIRESRSNEYKHPTVYCAAIKKSVDFSKKGTNVDTVYEESFCGQDMYMLDLYLGSVN